MTIREQIRSFAEYGGQPVWQLGGVKHGGRSRARFVAMAEHADAAVVHWRASRDVLFGFGAPHMPDFSLALLGRSLSVARGTQFADQDVLLVRTGSAGAWTVQQGEIALRMDGQSLGGLLRDVGIAGNPLVTLCADGLRIRGQVGGDACELLLTADPQRGLHYRWIDPPAAGSVREQMLGALGRLTRHSPNAHWLDWQWTRAPAWSDAGFGAAFEAGKVVLQHGRLVLDPGLLGLVLRDHPPGAALPPLSHWRIGVDRLEAHVDWTQQRIDRIAAGGGNRAGVPAGPRLIYVRSVTDQAPNETLQGEALAFSVVPTIVDRLRATRTDGLVTRAFMPVEQGWLQLPLPDSSAVATAAAPAPSVGGLEIGTRRLERETDAEQSKRLPWALSLSGWAGFNATFRVDASRIGRIDAEFRAPKLRLRGLLWLAVGRADDDDLLPKYELGSEFLRDLELQAPPDPASAWSIDARKLTIGAATWPGIAFDQLRLGGLAAPVVLWTRHPRLPAIQLMPLTSARDVPVRALESRELLPIVVDPANLQLDAVLNGWPQVNGTNWQRFWWPDAAPSAGRSAWPEYPDEGGTHLDRGFGLAALSMAGVEFWPDPALDAFAGAVRLDLSWSDERWALAGLPGPKRPSSEQWPDLAHAASGDIQRLWLARHDAWMLSLGKWTVLLDRHGTVDPQVLLPAFRWDGGVAVDDAIDGTRFGQITFDLGGQPVAHHGDGLLEGLHAHATLVDADVPRLVLSDAADEPRMLGFALPRLAHGDGHVDGDGTYSTALTAGLEQTVVQGSERRVRITLDTAQPLTIAGTPCAFWCRELPCTGDPAQGTFTRDDPCLADPALARLSGYEWRLWREGGDPSGRIPLNTWFEFEPVLLLRANHRDKRFDVVVEGWLHARAGSPRKLGLATVAIGADGTFTLAPVELVWELPPLRVHARPQPVEYESRPSIALTLDAGATIATAVLDLPLAGAWRTLDLRSVAADAFEIVRTSSGEVTVSSGSVRITAQRTYVDVVVDVDTDAFAIRTARTDGVTIAHTVTLQRFPAGLTTARPSADWDLIAQRGIAFTVEAASRDFQAMHGFTIAGAKHAWIAGLGFAEAGPLRVAHGWLEGSARDDAASIELVARRRIDAHGKAAWTHQTRLLGDWRTASDLAWPGASIVENGDRHDVTWDWSSPRHSAMTVHWRGQTIEGEGFACEANGSVFLPTRAAYEVLATHEIVAGTAVAARWKGLHPVFVGTVADWVEQLSESGERTLTPMFEDDAERAAALLQGMLGSAFVDALRPDALQRLRVVAATPAWLVGGRPLVFAHAACLDRAGNALTPVLRNALGQGIARSALSEFDVEPLELLGVTAVPASIRIDEHTAAAADVPAYWQRASVWELHGQLFEPGWQFVHQFIRAANMTGPVPALARSIVVLDRVLDGLSQDTPAWTVGVRAGRAQLVDVAALQLVRVKGSAFAQAPARSDVLLCGAAGFAVQPDGDGADSAAWLTSSIQARLGSPMFAARRGVGCAALPLQAVVLQARAGSNVRCAMFSDPAQGPARQPVAASNALAATLARSELLDRRPLALDGMRTTGTRHQYRLASAAGAGPALAVMHQDRVVFAPPRPGAVAASGLRAEWPAWRDGPDIAATPGAVAAGYRETLSFAQRPGAMRVHREVLLVSDGEQADAGLSLPHAHRAPRPLALPRERQCGSVLDPQQRFDVIAGVADVAWLPTSVLGNGGPLQWRPVLCRLTSPTDGIVSPAFGGKFDIAYDVRAFNPALPQPPLRPDDAFEWRATLLLGGRAIALDVDVDRAAQRFVLRPRAALDRPEGSDEARGGIQLTLCRTNAAPWLNEPSTTMTFPLVFVSGRRYGLPMQAQTVVFYDRLFNADLASEVVRSNETNGMHLIADRKAYDASGPMVLMVDGPNPPPQPPPEHRLALQRWRRDPGSGALDVREMQPIAFDPATDTWKTFVPRLLPGVPIRLDLSKFQPANADAGVAWKAGDMLRAQVTQGGPELLLAIADAPVLPPPNAAYALWRRDHAQAVRCAMYGAGVMPDRVELVDAARDLTAGRVRRFALFKWQLVTPRWIEGSRWFVQRFDHVGATHFPSSDDDFLSAEHAG
jgi:hypothetical protein